MKKIIALILVLTLCLACFAGCGEKAPEATVAPEATPTPEKAFADKYDTLELYLEAGFAPFEYSQGADIVGVDVEIAQAIADELGWKLKVNDVPFDGITAGLKAENAIAATGLTITPAREKQVDFSTPYFESSLAVIAKTGSIELDADGKVPAEAVKGLKIGTQTGTTGDTHVFQTIKPSKQAKGYVNVLNGIPDLKAGTIDIFIIDNLVALISASGTGILGEYSVYPLAGCDVEEYGVAVAKGNAELAEVVDAVVKEMLANGEIEALIEKHKDSAQ